MNWNISNLLKDEIYLELNPKFINDLKCQFKNKGVIHKNLAKRLGVNKATVSIWLSGINKIPYKTVIKFLKILDINQKVILENIQGIALGKGRVRINEPNLIINLDKNLFRLLGHIYGDGCVRSNMVISYTNLEQSLITDFIDSTNKVFGSVDCCIYKSKDKTLNVTLPKIIGKFLVKCFDGIQKKKIPLKHLLSDKCLIPEFIGAIFDDEGCVSVKGRQLLIRLSNYQSLKDLKLLLNSVGIESSPIRRQTKFHYIWYSLAICRRKNIEKFYNTIPLKHKRKKRLIENLISNYTRKYVDYELREAILSKLKDKPMTSSELVPLLGTSLSSVCKCLAEIEKLGFVTKEKVYKESNKKSRYAIYLWDLR